MPTPSAQHSAWSYSPENAAASAQCLSGPETDASSLLEGKNTRVGLVKSNINTYSKLNLTNKLRLSKSETDLHFSKEFHIR